MGRQRSSLRTDDIDPPVPTPSRRESPFEDLPELRSADGVIGIISRHTTTGLITFNILREFESYGDKKRTAFFPETMMVAYQAMVTLVFEEIAKLQKSLPPLERGSRAGR